MSSVSTVPRSFRMACAASGAACRALAGCLPPPPPVLRGRPNIFMMRCSGRLLLIRNGVGLSSRAWPSVRGLFLGTWRRRCGCE